MGHVPSKLSRLRSFGYLFAEPRDVGLQILSGSLCYIILHYFMDALHTDVALGGHTVIRLSTQLGHTASFY